MNVYKKFSVFSVRFVYILFTVFLLLVPFMYRVSEEQKSTIITCACFTIVFILLFVLICRMKYKKIRILSEKYIILALLLLCFIVKAAVILTIQIEPQSDYQTFYYTAEMLSEYTKIDFRYISLFPHILGYSSFLSVFFKIFGASYFLPPFLNVLLTVTSTYLIYKIAITLKGRRMACIASLLWIFMPSQSIYNIFVLSEPLYTCMLLCVWYILIKKVDIKLLCKKHSYILYVIVCGIFLSLINMCRPISLIPIIAFIIYMFIIDTENMKKAYVLPTIGLTAVLLVTYFCGNQVADYYVNSRLMEEASSIPGFTLYVGFNESSGGKWNPQDSDVLTRYNTDDRTPNEVQQIMMDFAMERIIDGNIDYPSFLLYKFQNLWATDDGAASYATYAFESEEIHKLVINISNAYYFMLVFFSFFGCIKALIKKENSKLFMILIFYIGLTLAHGFAEVAVRYHYAAMLSLVFAAAYFLCDMHIISNKLYAKISK